MKKLKLSKDKLAEYKGLIKQLNISFDGLPDALAKFGLELSSSPKPEETEEPNIDTLVQQDLQKHLSK